MTQIGAREDKLHAEVKALKKRQKALVRALIFYADPDSYFAIGMFPDRPCGAFINDCAMPDENVWGHCARPFHGKRARAVLTLHFGPEPLEGQSS